MQNNVMPGFVAEVVDLFCGVGALSHGLLRAGFDIRAGYDTDHRCKHAFETNNESIFFCSDVAYLEAEEVSSHFSGDLPTVLAGCAPCQPFSTYKYRYGEDPQWDLVGRFARLAVKVKPDFITMENVPSLLKYKEGRVFEHFKAVIEDAGYKIHWQVAKCEDYGVPQHRRRLVVVASLHGLPQKLKISHSTPLTVRQAIGALPSVEAGKCSRDDQLHVSASLSEMNMARMRASKPGGTWRDWPFELRAKCHQKASGKTYSGVYARMDWDKPSPTLTTQCYGFGNGRFGHPEQDRAITLREAAILQSFPSDYSFLPDGEALTLSEVGRWIGNAVPVRLAEAIGNSMNAIIGSNDYEKCSKL